MPGAAAWTVLEAAVVRVGPVMSAQDVASTIRGYAVLGRVPGVEAWGTLEAAAARVAPRMNAQEVSNTLWSVLFFAATRGVPLTACYPALWRAVRGVDVASFKDVDLSNVFHAHLMHTELVSGDVLDDVTFPPWIMHKAREAWMSNAQNDVTVSRSHKEVASIIGELGVTHEVEHLTDDGYFSAGAYTRPLFSST